MNLVLIKAKKQVSFSRSRFQDKDSSTRDHYQRNWLRAKELVREEEETNKDVISDSILKGVWHLPEPSGNCGLEVQLLEVAQSCLGQRQGSQAATPILVSHGLQWGKSCGVRSQGWNLNSRMLLVLWRAKQPRSYVQFPQRRASRTDH